MLYEGASIDECCGACGKVSEADAETLKFAPEGKCVNCRRGRILPHLVPYCSRVCEAVANKRLEETGYETWEQQMNFLGCKALAEKFDAEMMQRAAEMQQPDTDADQVDSPPHYNQSGIECIDAIEACLGDAVSAYYQGNILKYLWRHPYKGKPVEDLKKAAWYLERLTSHLIG